MRVLAGAPVLFCVISHGVPACLTDMSTVSQDLLDKSKQFSWGAKRRNVLESLKKYLPCILLVFVVIVVFYLRFLR